MAGFGPIHGRLAQVWPWLRAESVVESLEAWHEAGDAGAGWQLGGGEPGETTRQRPERGHARDEGAGAFELVGGAGLSVPIETGDGAAVTGEMRLNRGLDEAGSDGGVGGVATVAEDVEDGVGDGRVGAAGHGAFAAGHGIQGHGC